VIDFGGEAHSRRFEGVVLRELDTQTEDAALIRCIRRAVDDTLKGLKDIESTHHRVVK
jgi:hypothetical protein